MQYGARPRPRPRPVRPPVAPKHCQGRGRRAQMAGSCMDRSHEVLSSPYPTPPHMCTHSHVRVCRGIHTCAEVWIQVLVPDASPPVRTCAPPEGALRYHSDCSKPSLRPPAPAPAQGCPWSRAGQRGAPPIPSLGQCQLKLSPEDPHCSRMQSPKRVSVGLSPQLALRGWCR